MVRIGDAGSITGTNKLTIDSIQEALRMYFQPIKNDDPKLDFFTMYKRETTEYDAEYMNKYNEDLNTTLIFVSSSISSSTHSVDLALRPACSLRSVPPSLLMSSRASSQIQPNDLRPISAPFSSPSTHQFFPVRVPPLLQLGAVPPKRSLRHRTSCTQVCRCRCWPRSSRCWVNSG